MAEPRRVPPASRAPRATLESGLQAQRDVAHVAASLHGEHRVAAGAQATERLVERLHRAQWGGHSTNPSSRRTGCQPPPPDRHEPARVTRRPADRRPRPRSTDTSIPRRLSARVTACWGPSQAVVSRTAPRWSLDEVARLLRTVATKTLAMLQRRGRLDDDAAAPAETYDHLLCAAHASPQSSPTASVPTMTGRQCAQLEGFSLHAAHREIQVRQRRRAAHMRRAAGRHRRLLGT